METSAGSVALDANFTHIQKRLFVRRDVPLWPFVWRGLLPTVGLLVVTLYAVGPFAKQWIEANVQRSVRAALDAEGMQWVRMVVDGQNVWLSGTVPGEGAGERALEVARQTTCGTWLGPKICAVTVDGTFDRLRAAAPAQVPALVSACDQSFANVMAQSAIEFSTNSAIISPTSERVLQRLADAHKNCSGVGVVVVEGHTDSIGRPEANHELSEARAAAVRDALVRLGVPADRLAAKGFGAEYPVAGNDSADGRAKNRRIEFHAIAPN